MLRFQRLWKRSLPKPSVVRNLSLAYQLHEPPNHDIARHPLVILHGLFGSKQNNRSVSK